MLDTFLSSNPRSLGVRFDCYLVEIVFTEKSRISEKHCILQAKVSLWYSKLKLLVIWFENFDFFQYARIKSFMLYPARRGKQDSHEK